MKVFRGFLATLLAVVLAVGMAGCNSSDTTWVYDYDGDVMPAGVYINYMINAYYEGYSKLIEDVYAQLAESESDEQTEALYAQASELYEMKQSQLLKQQLDGVSLDQWIQRRAQEYAMQYYASRELFRQYGLELDAQSQSTVESGLAMILSAQGYGMEQLYQNNGIAESSARLVVENEEVKNLLFEHLYGDGGEYGLNTAQLEEAIDADNANLRYLTVYKSTEEEGEPDGDAEADGEAASDAEPGPQAEELAQGYLARLEEGESFEAVYLEAEGAEPQASIATRDAGYSVYAYDNFGEYITYPQVVSDGVFEMAIGETVLLEDESAFYLVERLAIEPGSDAYASLSYSVLRELKYDEFTALLDEYAAGLSPQVNEASIKRYKADWLDLS